MLHLRQSSRVYGVDVRPDSQHGCNFYAPSVTIAKPHYNVTLRAEGYNVWDSDYAEIIGKRSDPRYAND